jgi:hypothetical protein
MNGRRDPFSTSGCHPNDPAFEPSCAGCDQAGRCRCDDEARCERCRTYHRPSENCPEENPPMAEIIVSPTVRPSRYQPRSFAAFRLTNVSASKTPKWKTVPIEIGQVSSATEAVEQAKLRCFHKDRLAVREADENGDISLHLYAVKQQSQPIYVPDGLELRRQLRLYVDPICTISEAAFATDAAA